MNMDGHELRQPRLPDEALAPPVPDVPGLVFPEVITTDEEASLVAAIYTLELRPSSSEGSRRAAGALQARGSTASHQLERLPSAGLGWWA